MHVLIAHRGQGSRNGLAEALKGRGFDLAEVDDGGEALEFLLGGDVPRVALVDWDLPTIEGPELCRLVRDFHLEDPPYIILLAALAHHGDVAVGLEAGANDCVRTPVTAAELRARVEMGRRFVELPWGQPDDAAAGRGAPSDGLFDGGITASLQAFIDADPAGSDASRDDGPARLDALLGDRWQTV